MKGASKSSSLEEVRLTANEEEDNEARRQKGRIYVVAASAILVVVVAGLGLGLGFGLGVGQARGHEAPKDGPHPHAQQQAAPVLLLPSPDHITPAQLSNMSADAQVYYSAYSDHEAITPDAVRRFLDAARQLLPPGSVPPEAAAEMEELSSSLLIYMRAHGLDRALTALRGVAKGENPFRGMGRAGGVGVAGLVGNATRLLGQIKKAVDLEAVQEWVKLPVDTHEAIMHNATKLTPQQVHKAVDSGLAELAAQEALHNTTIFPDGPSEFSAADLFPPLYGSPTPPTRNLRAASPAPRVPSATAGYLKIPIVIHVLQYKDANGNLLPPTYWSGNAPFVKLVAALNAVHAKFRTGFQFTLYELRTDIKKHPYLNLGTLKKWQACSLQGPDCLDYIAQDTSKDVSRYMNIYTSGTRQQAGCEACPFGFAYTPYEGSQTDSLQGYVWVLWDRIDPSVENSAKAYEAGIGTFVHETGHWMGLDHTHRGGCLDQDGVSDTPANLNGVNQPWYMQLSALCVAWKKGGSKLTTAQLAHFNSCPAKGVDNVFNYLSYNPAACRVLFTKGQVKHMQALTFKFRPALIAAARAVNKKAG